MVYYCSIFHQFSQSCPLCGEKISCPQMSFCVGCYRQLPWLINSCRFCANPLPGDSQEVCGSCLINPPPYQSYCLFHYRHPVDKLVSLLKYHHQLFYGRILGYLLAEHLQNQGLFFRTPQVIIPVPLHPKRLKKRGYNQSHEIARYCAKRLNIPLLHDSCRRTINSPPQSDLDAKTRRRNLRGAFSAKIHPNIKSVAIVDDVMTTGTTATELSKTLLNEGVNDIQIWCIARTSIE